MKQIAAETPERLDLSLYQNAKTFEDVDEAVWLYLCRLVPKSPGSHRQRTEKMLNSISPELRRFFLARQFDWERGSGGLESCMMAEDDEMFVQLTVIAFESLGATEHAKIIREMVPIAQRQWKAIRSAEAAGSELDLDDPFEPFESRWDAASERFDFYDVIFSDMKEHPEKYVHP